METFGILAAAVLGGYYVVETIRSRKLQVFLTIKDETQPTLGLVQSLGRRFTGTTEDSTRLADEHEHTVLNKLSMVGVYLRLGYIPAKLTLETYTHQAVRVWLIFGPGIRALRGSGRKTSWLRDLEYLCRECLLHYLQEPFEELVFYGEDGKLLHCVTKEELERELAEMQAKLEEFQLHRPIVHRLLGSLKLWLQPARWRALLKPGEPS